MLGHWKNFNELEENLTLDELQAILQEMRKRTHEDLRTRILMNGGEDIGEYGANANSEGTTFEDVKRRAEAKLMGVSETQLEFAELGIQVIED